MTTASPDVARGMNNTLDPFVKAMRDAEDDAARANVLLTAPVFTLMRWKSVFHRYCRAAAFDHGADYLDALAEALSKPRHIGVLPGSAHEALRIRLLYVAEGSGQ